MKYILEGDEKELGRVLREQRIRIGRGLIKITPISGTLVHEDYALKAIEAQVKELTDTLALKDGQIESLTSERDSLRARMTEMEASGSMPETDEKEVDMKDSKTLNITDSNNLPEDDSMSIDMDNVNPSVNTSGKKTTKKKESCLCLLMYHISYPAPGR